MSTKPANPNTDRDERVRQIRERAQGIDTDNWYRRQAYPVVEARKDIDYLLSLLDSQAAATSSPAPASSDIINKERRRCAGIARAWLWGSLTDPGVLESVGKYAAQRCNGILRAILSGADASHLAGAEGRDSTAPAERTRVEGERWTKEAPVVDGIYWWRADSRDSEPDIHRVVGGIFFEVGEQFSRVVEGFGGEWLGPITPAAAPADNDAESERTAIVAYLELFRGPEILPMLVADIKAGRHHDTTTKGDP